MKDTRSKLRAKNEFGNVRRSYFAPARLYIGFVLFASCYLLLISSGCGFHLRGQGGTAPLPEKFSVMRVNVINSQVAGDFLRFDMKRALTGAGVTVVDREDERVPSLNLYDERSDARVVTVTQDARVSDFVLRYQVAFDVTDRTGKPIVDRQTITLQRVFTFDRFAVLAKEREAQETRNQMREDAVQQIIRRLSAQS